MILRRIELCNYRGFAREYINLDRRVTVIVGGNDTGKSNLLLALKNYLSPDVIDPLRDRTKGSALNEKPEIRSMWQAQRTPKKVRDRLAELTEAKPDRLQVSLSTSNEGCSLWADERGEKTAKKRPPHVLRPCFPEIYLLDLSTVGLARGVPHSIDSIAELKNNENILLRKVLELGGTDIDTLSRYTPREQRQRLPSAADPINKILSGIPGPCPMLLFNVLKDGGIDFDFKDEDAELFFPSERGYGLQVLVFVLAELLDVIAKSKGRLKPIILIDEPENSLHPGAQKVVREFLNGVAQEGFQVVYATHSPFMIDPNHVTRVRLVWKDKTACKVENKCYRRLHEEPIQSALQLPLGHSLFLAERNVLVEGVSDQLLMVSLSQACAAMGMAHLDLRNTSVIPLCGAGESTMGALRARTVKRQGRLVCVFDKDEQGWERAKQAREAGLPRIYANGDVPEQERITETLLTTEDLVPRAVYVEAVVRNHEGVRADGRLQPASPGADELRQRLASAPGDPPILQHMQALLEADETTSAFQIRKVDVAQEASYLLLENVPGLLTEQEQGASLYTQEDLEAVSLLFKKVDDLLRQDVPEPLETRGDELGHLARVFDGKWKKLWWVGDRRDPRSEEVEFRSGGTYLAGGKPRFQVQEVLIQEAANSLSFSLAWPDGSYCQMLCMEVQAASA